MDFTFRIPLRVVTKLEPIVLLSEDATPSVRPYQSFVVDLSTKNPTKTEPGTPSFWKNRSYSFTRFKNRSTDDKRTAHDLCEIASVMTAFKFMEDRLRIVGTKIPKAPDKGRQKHNVFWTDSEQEAREIWRKMGFSVKVRRETLPNPFNIIRGKRVKGFQGHLVYEFKNMVGLDAQLEAMI